MRLEKWESIIQTIVDECNQEQERPDDILKTWREKLEGEPTLLQPFQIDEIVRAIRGRLTDNR